MAVTDLDEAATTALKEQAASDVVHVTVVGVVHAHLHFTLMPHRSGDALAGGDGVFKEDAVIVEEQRLRDVADRVRSQLMA